MFPARIDDGCDVNDWHVADYRTGPSIPLRADRWYQKASASDSKSNSGNFACIRINIWNHTILKYLLDKIARFLYEYHYSEYLSLDLPPLELGRSDTDVHGVLEPHQVDE
jgi:hypothetical protein